MNAFIPHTDAERAAMLEAVGAQTIDDLFRDIPAALRRDPPPLPAVGSEYELAAALEALAARNTAAVCFLGGGVYDRYIPAVVESVVSRQEFVTAYTPYQAEMSQGTLQAIFEYQTMMASLTGMDVGNASLYDGATAAAEAMLMACRATGRDTAVIVGSVHEQIRAVCRTYAACQGLTVKETHPLAPSAAAETLVDDSTAVLLAQSPNYYGVVEDWAVCAEIAHRHGALFAAIAEPVSLALLEPPGALGADIAVGEGQPLGVPMSFGGPGFGFMTCRQSLLRKLPGRIVGQTADAAGRRGFVLTLQAREQHIRREAATSNICTNQALCALTAAVYLATLGPDGLRRVAAVSTQKARYLRDKLLATGLFQPVFDGPTLFEFTLRYTGGDLPSWIKRMTDAGILPGLDLSAQKGLENCLLIAVTEKRGKAQLDAYAAHASERTSAHETAV